MGFARDGMRRLWAYGCLHFLSFIPPFVMLFVLVSRPFVCSTVITNFVLIVFKSSNLGSELSANKVNVYFTDLWICIF
jgi:hypothetical protein